MHIQAVIPNRLSLWWWSCLLLCAAFVLPLFTAEAASPPSPPATVQGHAPPLLQVTLGKASFYSRKHNGKKTANGQRIDNSTYTAAHPTLPFGTIVRVTNLRNGRDVIVRINDRGPFVKGRIIDLSRTAAETLNMIRSGVTDVQVEVLSDAKGKISQPESAFFLTLKEPVRQGQTTQALERARTLLRKAEKDPARQVQILVDSRPGRTTRYFAALGPYATYATVSAVRKRLKADQVSTRIRWAPVNFD